MMEFEPFPEDEADGAQNRRSTTIQSISIAMRFLQALAQSGRALPLGELAQLTRTGRSTAHRYMQSLVKEGLAQQDPATSHYDLGAAALSIGIAALRRVDAVELAGAQMRLFVENQPLSGGVAIWTDRGPTLVRWYRSANFSIAPRMLGDVLPIDNSACGLVFQAHLPRDMVEAARRMQPAQFRGTPPSRDRIDRIRTEGWSEMSNQLLAGAAEQAVPVLDAQGSMACVLTTVAEPDRRDATEQQRALQDLARLVNRATGGRSAFA